MITTDSKAVRYGCLHHIKPCQRMPDTLYYDGYEFIHRTPVGSGTCDMHIHIGQYSEFQETRLKFLAQHYLENLSKISIVNIKGLLYEQLQLVPIELICPNLGIDIIRYTNV